MPIEWWLNNCIDAVWPKYQVHCSHHKSRISCRKEFLKLVHRNPAIMAGWKGGRPVKRLIKILQGWLWQHFGSVYRLTDGCLLAQAPAATLILPRKSKMPCSRSQHKSVTSWLPQSEGDEWACMVGCIPKRCLTCTAVEHVTVVA